MFVHRFLILTTIGLLFATVLNVQGKAIITVADSSSEHTDTDLENLPEIPVFGHTNPDTDAIGSAIAYTAYLREHKTNAKAYRLGTLNKETLYVLNYTGAEMPPLLPDNIANGSQVILVDHNESPQSMKNLKYMQVIRVVDHHKIGDLTTVLPVYLRFEPVGCAATVLAKTFFENNFKIKRTIAQLIISAIISDTLYFRTASTTADDHHVVEKLQGISEIKDLEAYSTEMFKAKSDLSGYTTRQILLLDYKSYVFNGQSWGIGVADTWYPDFLFNLKNDLLYEMAVEKANSGLTGILFSIIDILNQKNTMLVPGETEKTVIEGAFNVTVINNEADLGARLSRKLQLVPPMQTYIDTHY